MHFAFNKTREQERRERTLDIWYSQCQLEILAISSLWHAYGSFELPLPCLLLLEKQAASSHFCRDLGAAAAAHSSSFRSLSSLLPLSFLFFSLPFMSSSLLPFFSSSSFSLFYAPFFYNSSWALLSISSSCKKE